MPDPGSNRPAHRADSTGSWRADLEGATPPPADGTPTVRTGASGSGRASYGPIGSTGSSMPPRERLQPAPLPAPGEQLGGFLLERAIGVGGMGAVFLALD